MKCKCGKRLSRAGLYKKEVTGLCKACYVKSIGNRLGKRVKADLEPQQILRALAKQNMKYGVRR